LICLQELRIAQIGEVLQQFDASVGVAVPRQRRKSAVGAGKAFGRVADNGGDPTQIAFPF
jgi:hypothetical protein